MPAEPTLDTGAFITESITAGGITRILLAGADGFTTGDAGGSTTAAVVGCITQPVTVGAESSNSARAR